MMKKNWPLPILIVLLIALVSCTGPSADKGQGVATVNSSPVLLTDLQKEVSMALKRDPGLKITPESLEEMVETMIDRKLLIDEAVKKGLSEDERFLESIKTFWEQTLIRQLIEQKNREWADRLFVTDEEVRARYALMAHKVTLKVIKAPDDGGAEMARDTLLKDRSRGEVMGPLFAENMKYTDPLYAVFGLKEGDTGVIESGYDHLAFRVAKLEHVSVPPVEEVYPRIQAALLEEKKERALNGWLKELKGAAKVSVDMEALRKAADGR